MRSSDEAVVPRPRIEGQPARSHKRGHRTSAAGSANTDPAHGRARPSRYSRDGCELARGGGNACIDSRRIRAWLAPIGPGRPAVVQLATRHGQRHGERDVRGDSSSVAPIASTRGGARGAPILRPWIDSRRPRDATRPQPRTAPSALSSSPAVACCAHWLRGGNPLTPEASPVGRVWRQRRWHRATPRPTRSRRRTSRNSKSRGPITPAMSPTARPPWRQRRSRTRLILHDGTLYLCTPYDRVIALDATTGEERWIFDPEVETDDIYITACRGVSYWEDELAGEGSACRSRIVLGTLDARLIALDASSACRARASAAAEPSISLRASATARPGEYGVTSPPAIRERRHRHRREWSIDNRRVDAPGGVVRGFDARSGALALGVGSDSARRARNRRAIHARNDERLVGVLSADPALGLVYAPTGNTSPDYFGGHRQGLDYYSSSIVCARRQQPGEVRWHFQTVHHDIWDYDLPLATAALRLSVAERADPGSRTTKRRWDSSSSSIAERVNHCSDRGTPGAAGADRRRGPVCDPTLPAASERAAASAGAGHRRRCLRFHLLRPRQVPRADRERSLRRRLHATVDPGHDPLPRHDGRLELGKRFSRPTRAACSSSTCRSSRHTFA